MNPNGTTIYWPTVLVVKDGVVLTGTYRHKYPKGEMTNSFQFHLSPEEAASLRDQLANYRTEQESLEDERMAKILGDIRRDAPYAARERA